MVSEYFRYHKHNIIVQGLKKGIPHVNPNSAKIVNVHFLHDSFLTIVEVKHNLDNTMDSLI